MAMPEMLESRPRQRYLYVRLNALSQFLDWGEDMRFSLKLALVLALVLSVALLYASGPGDAKKGKELFANKCTTCHGDKGEGKPTIEKVLNVKMRPLSSKEVLSKSDEQLKKNLVEGNGKMKPVKLADSEAADILAYLRTLAQGKK
jgi:mono/diheme cytochrome c family protein